MRSKAKDRPRGLVYCCLHPPAVCRALCLCWLIGVVSISVYLSSQAWAAYAVLRLSPFVFPNDSDSGHLVSDTPARAELRRELSEGVPA